MWIGKNKNLTKKVIGLIMFAGIIQNTKPYAVIKLPDNSQN